MCVYKNCITLFGSEAAFMKVSVRNIMSNVCIVASEELKFKKLEKKYGLSKSINQTQTNELQVHNPLSGIVGAKCAWNSELFEYYKSNRVHMPCIKHS